MVGLFLGRLENYTNMCTAYECPLHHVKDGIFCTIDI
jgi:hypothetical protein